MSGSMSFNNLSSLSGMNTSMSFSDLNAEMNNLNQHQSNQTDSSNNTSAYILCDSTARSTRSTLGGLGSMSSRGEEGMNNKPFGLGKIIR